VPTDFAARTLDFSRPVGVMLVAVLHLIPDEVPAEHLPQPGAGGRFFAGLELIEPSVVPVQHWRPDAQEEAEAVTADVNASRPDPPRAAGEAW
jgi:hypothetical protein